MNVYHYTDESRLKKIIASGVIKAATVLIDPGEKPAVWFSTLERYEPTAFKLLRQPDGQLRMGTWLDMEEHGAARIRIEPSWASLDWWHWRKASGVRPSTAKRMETTALMAGSNVAYFRVSLVPVPSSAWLTIEFWDKKQQTWVGYNAGKAGGLPAQAAQD